MDTLLNQPAVTWSDPVIIRPITAADLPALEWNGEYARFRKIYADAYDRFLRGLTLIYVADLPGVGVIGQVFVQLICDRLELADGVDRAYLYSFRILPAYRGRGLGTLMMNRVEEELTRRNFSWVTLNVAKDNPGAQRLYQRRGYQVVAHEPGRWFYPDENGVWQVVDEPAWRMEKQLTPMPQQ